MNKDFYSRNAGNAPEGAKIDTGAITPDNRQSRPECRKPTEANAEAAIFRDAIARLNIKSIEAPRIFNVHRQTLYRWTSGKSEIPKAAFVKLLEIENAATGTLHERLDSIRDLAKHMNSKLSAPEAETEAETESDPRPRPARRRKK